MESEAPQEKDITKLIGDEYSERILSTTHRNPMTTQDLSRICGIPIAVAYRRVGYLERIGLLKCVGQEEVSRGKKVSYYQCAVRALKVTFAEGQFNTELELLPEEDMIKRPELSAKNAKSCNGMMEIRQLVKSRWSDAHDLTSRKLEDSHHRKR